MSSVCRPRVGPRVPQSWLLLVQSVAEADGIPWQFPVLTHVALVIRLLIGCAIQLFTNLAANLETY